MTDGLPLAPGSELVPELNTVTNNVGVKHFVASDDSGSYIDSCQHGVHVEIHATDARFLLHRSGNLPEVDELAKLREAAIEATWHLEALLSYAPKAGYVQWHAAVSALYELKDLLPKEDRKDG